MIGQTIQHYRVIGRLGEGGMGVVWLAEDIRLGRQVALKVLSTSLSADPAALDRFETEARLASSIAHPHIVSIYDVGSFGDGRFIAMELVDGQNLDRLLATRRLRVDEVVEWALQVADALAAAHRVGVFHRDVKPANIYIARGGYAKLGDFGIAKLFEQGHDPGATMAPGTTAGMVLGSPHYLSPEQAQGEPLDARTDVFSFAATLYEMLTGHRAFAGSSAAEVIASVLRENPAPPSRVHPEIPRALDAIVTKGLEKRREYRYQHMDDVVADLRRVKRDLESGKIGDDPAQRSSGRSRVGVRSVAALALLVGAILGALISFWGLPPGRAGNAERRTYDLARVTSEPGLEDAPTWSPDGRSLAYTSDDNGHLGIWIRQIPGERSIRVGTSDVDEGHPTWSPDGNWIAFVSSRNRGGRFGIFLGSRPIEMYVAGQNGDLFVMPALGGTARKLADDAYDPSWSPDGSRLAFRSIRDGAWRLYTVALDGGQLAPIKGVEPRALAPAWSPDGDWIAYVAGASAATGWDVYAVPARGGTPVQITNDRATIALAPAWSRDGRSIMYSSNRAGPVNLWRVAFNVARPAASQPERLTTGIGEDINPGAAPDGSSIAYATVHTAPDIWALDVGTRHLRQLTSETTVEDYPRLSPEGERLLFYSDRTGADEVWMMRLATRELTRVSRSGGTQNAWSPDGRHVAYGTSKGLQLVDLNGGEGRTLAAGLGVAYPAFSRDGRRIAFQGWNGHDYRLYQVPVDGGQAQLISTPVGEPGNPSWSPDGRTIYFQLDQFGRRNIWSASLETGQARQLTQGDADDAHPDVSSDGARLLFLRHHGDLYVMPADGTGAPQLLFAAREHNQLVEWPAWGSRDTTVVFSLAQMTGDLFLLRESHR